MITPSIEPDKRGSFCLFCTVFNSVLDGYNANFRKKWRLLLEILRSFRTASYTIKFYSIASEWRQWDKGTERYNKLEGLVEGHKAKNIPFYTELKNRLRPIKVDSQWRREEQKRLLAEWQVWVLENCVKGTCLE